MATPQSPPRTEHPIEHKPERPGAGRRGGFCPTNGVDDALEELRRLSAEGDATGSEFAGEAARQSSDRGLQAGVRSSTARRMIGSTGSARSVRGGISLAVYVQHVDESSRAVW
jgi:hypothetical protein